MSKIRVLIFGVAIFSLNAGGLRANSLTQQLLNSSGLFSTTVPPDNSTTVQTTVQPYVSPATVLAPISYTSNVSPYDYSSTSNNSSMTSTVPSVDTSIINNLQPYTFQSPFQSPLLSLLLTSLLPVPTTVTIPTIQPSNVNTVTTQVPTIQVTTNFNNMTGLPSINEIGDPEPSTVVLLFSGTVLLAILHRKRSKPFASVK